MTHSSTLAYYCVPMTSKNKKFILGLVGSSMLLITFNLVSAQNTETVEERAVMPKFEFQIPELKFPEIIFPEIEIPEIPTFPTLPTLPIDNPTTTEPVVEPQLPEFPVTPNPTSTTPTTTEPVTPIIPIPELPITPTDPVASTTDITDELLTPEFGEILGPVPDQYIIVLKKDAMNDQKEKIRSFLKEKNRKIKGELQYVRQGYIANMSAADAEMLKNNPEIESIEQDQVFSINATTQSNPVWSLDRVDQANLPLNKSYSYDTDGSGVHVYILDTGINANHQEFAGRIGEGYDFIDNDSQPQDCNGHGTHVAGTIAGTTYGAAKKATIHSVRVLDCNGSGMSSSILQGIDWIAKNHKGATVANMSLGSTKSTSVNNAVQNAIGSGVNFVVAAGNDNKDACGYSPASTGNAITVGATNFTDARSTFSNYGSCVDIFAPGEKITSSDYQNNSGSKTMSGTSMASPLVAGVVARYLSGNPSASTDQVSSAIKSWGIQGKVSNPGGGSVNLLLNIPSSNSGTPSPTPTPEPTPTPAPGTTQAVVSMNVTKSAASRTYSMVRGVVVIKDASGNPLSNARVSVEASGAINGRGTWTTNQAGQMNFSAYTSKNSQSTFTVTSVVDQSGKSLQLGGTLTKTI